MVVEPNFLNKIKQMQSVNIDVVEIWVEEQRQYPSQRIEDAEIMFCTFVPLNFSEMKKLKLIQISSSGYSQLFGFGLVEKGIRV